MSVYGQPEGLVDRLEAFVQRSRTDKSVPWFGTGILADMELACRFLRGEPAQKPSVDLEYDL